MSDLLNNQDFEPVSPVSIPVTLKQRPVKIDLKTCPRCGNTHEGLEFSHITKPILDREGFGWDWWAACPTLNEPILLAREYAK